MTHSVHVALDLVERASGIVENSAKAPRIISGVEAFRRYGWLRNIRPANRVGNFRGMVISSRWATVYHIANTTEEWAGRVGTIASLLTNTVKVWPELDRIVQSNDPWEVKGAKVSTQVSSVCLRTAGGVVTTSSHLLAMSIGGYLQAADLMGFHKASQWNRSVGIVDAWIDTKLEQVTDGNNMYLFINKYLVLH